VLLGVGGRRVSGKDAIGAYLVTRHGFVRFAFADAIRSLLLRLGWDGAKDERGRRWLQELGQGGREELGSFVWIRGLERRARAQLGPGWRGADIVVTDVRMPNECAWIHAHGGVVVRVVRPAIARTGTADQHATEVAVDGLDADFEIENSGTLDDLYARVETIVANLRTKRGD
jgi:hypothetical protein